MQFKSIIAVLSMALAATAAPNPTSSTAPPSQCSAGQTTACCPTTQSGIIDVSLSCFALSLIQLLNPNCAPQQVLACCNSGPQSGNLIAVGTVCAPITL
ncbi:hypothetical protein N7G274_004312 [Stereocaulon virgatum]|uniref:Hydrophobin n=1 Tax=Stereocaulon virgatum TaxID=373712 RepID=A0ABR4ABL3_9LECA